MNLNLTKEQIAVWSRSLHADANRPSVPLKETERRLLLILFEGGMQPYCPLPRRYGPLGIPWITP